MSEDQTFYYWKGLFIIYCCGGGGEGILIVEKLMF